LVKSGQGYLPLAEKFKEELENDTNRAIPVCFKTRKRKPKNI
jgi:hypothetical protein